MTDKINGYGRMGLDVGPARARAVNRAERDAGADSSRGATGAADAVAITGTAARLKAIEARLAALPEVDQARVKALRDRVESGEYKPDPGRIAARLIRMDKDLA